MRVVAGGALDLAVVGADLSLFHFAVRVFIEKRRRAIHARRSIEVNGIRHRKGDPDRVVVPQVRAEIEHPEIDCKSCTGTRSDI